MHLRIGTGSLNLAARRRTPLALAAACLLTGAAGLYATFERPHNLVPFEPTDYAFVQRPASELGPALPTAPGDSVDSLGAADALVAVAPEPEPSVEAAAGSARVAAAGAVNTGGSGIAELPPPPTPTPEATAVLDSPVPETPTTPEAVAPPVGPSSGAPSSRVITVQTGSSVVTVGGGASVSTNKGTPSGPSATNNKSASPTKTAATPTATPKAKSR